MAKRLMAVSILFVAILGCGIAQSPKISPPVSNYKYVTPITIAEAAIIGQEYPVVLMEHLQKEYHNSSAEYSISYPSDWSYVEQNQNVVNFYPPDSDPDSPDPLISFKYIPTWIFNPQKPFVETGSEIKPVIVNNVEGIQYQDVYFAVPNQSFYIELPYREGTILINATMGPYINLVPQLGEMLKAIKFQ